jgi:hypothetical protein
VRRNINAAIVQNLMARPRQLREHRSQVDSLGDILTPGSVVCVTVLSRKCRSLAALAKQDQPDVFLQGTV